MRGSTSWRRTRRSSAWAGTTATATRRPRCWRAWRRTASRCSEPTSAARSLSPRTATVQGSEVITIERFIMEQERLHPEATGELSNLLYDLCLAAKIISRHVRRAGLSDILGPAGAVNVSGDLQQKLDLFANETVRQSVQYTGRVCVTASEEDPAPVPVPPGKPSGKYVVLYDPLDGSANIDVNVSIGTIFSIHKRLSKRTGTAGLSDCLQVGKKQVAAGYILYGSSTMLVYTTGQGVHGFTLDPTIGEFLLSHPNITTPPVGRYYSVNESNWNRWAPAVQRVVGAFKNGEGEVQPKNARYIGSLVADFHRNLISGGIFLYPAATNYPQGKLRLLYEAAPLALVVEQAGGRATDGCRSILAIVPEDPHQKTPAVIGRREHAASAARIIGAEAAVSAPCASASPCTVRRTGPAVWRATCG